MLALANYEAAIDFFSELLQARVQQFGEQSLQAAPAWFEYGRALLLKEQENPSDDLLGTTTTTTINDNSILPHCSYSSSIALWTALFFTMHNILFSVSRITLSHSQLNTTQCNTIHELTRCACMVFTPQLCHRGRGRRGQEAGAKSWRPAGRGYWRGTCTRMRVYMCADIYACVLGSLNVCAVV